MISDKILDRIKKLINLSSNNSNVNEAATAFGQAQTLLEKYRLTLADVENLDVLNEEIQESPTALCEGERVVTWKISLADKICRLNSCKVFIRYDYSKGKKNSKYAVVGRPTDIEIVQYLFVSIVSQIEHLCKIEQKLHNGYGKTWSNNFKHGAAETVAKRLKEAQAVVRQEHATSAGLVLVRQREAEVAVWLKKAVPNMKDRAAVQVRGNLSALEAGREAGKQIQLNKGMEPKKPTGLLN